MKKTAAVRSSEFYAKLQETVSLAFTVCENRIKAKKYAITPELTALSAAALSLKVFPGFPWVSDGI